MTGIVFFGTERHDDVVGFYRDVVGADVWLEQPGCTILEHGNLLVGFCDREETEDCGTVTFVYDDREAVDEMYERVGDAARDAPRENERYQIYQFFADDPDGRAVEFQTFLHEVDR